MVSAVMRALMAAGACLWVVGASTESAGNSTGSYADEESWHTGYACEGSELQIRCAEGTVIHVLNANYGRLHTSLCNDHGVPDTWNLQCISEKAVIVVRNRCEGGVVTCNIDATNRVFGDPCVNTPKYLQVNYQCLPVTSSTPTTPEPSSSGSLTTTTPQIQTRSSTVHHVAPPTTGRRTNSTPVTAANSTESSSFCEPTRFRDVDWPRTAPGQTALERCPNNRNALNARWSCGSTEGGTRWRGSPDLSECVSESVTSLRLAVDSLKQSVNDRYVDSVSNILEGLVDITYNERDLYGGDIRSLMSVMVDVVNVSSDALLPHIDVVVADAVAANISTVMIMSGSNLLSDERTPSWRDLPEHMQAEAANKLLLAVEASAFMRAGVSDQPRTVAIDDQPNILLEFDVIDTTAMNNDLVFQKLHSSADTSWKESFGFIRLKANNIREISGVAQVVFTAYSNIERWLKPSSQNHSTHSSRAPLDQSQWKVGSKVVSATVRKGQASAAGGQKISLPVEYILQHSSEKNESYSSLCAYWQSATQTSSDGYWSSEGCEVVSSNSTHTLCSCNHLTNFAILMSVTGAQISDVHHFSLALITYFGCIISLVCLLLAFATFIAFKNLQCDRNTIHKNLVLTLFIAETIFLLGIAHYDKPVICSVIAGVLHYFFLAAFCWMCMEGIQLYVMLVEVFEAERSRLKWYYLAAYGVPAVIVIVSAAVNHTGYGTLNHCWLSVERGFIWAFVGPVIAILAVNIVMLSIAMYTMCRHAHTSVNSWQMKQKTKLENIASWLKGASVLIVLLGLTWLFGLFYVDSHSIFMAYVFTLLNSFQGLFIFVFHCLMSDKVQKEYRKCIQKTTWLPEAVRVKYGGATASVGGTSLPNQSTSTGGGNYLAKIFGSRRRKHLSSSSMQKMQMLSNSSKDGCDKVLIVVSPPDDSLERRSKVEAHSSGSTSRSDSARLTDSSSCPVSQRHAACSESSYAENTEDPSGYMEPTLTNVDEADFAPADDVGDNSLTDCSVVEMVDYQRRSAAQRSSSRVGLVNK